MIQEQLFDTPPVVESASRIPPTVNPPTIAQPLGPCCKCGEPAVVASPGGSLYCATCGKCGGKSVEQTALGIEGKVCGRSVEEFVMHPRMGIWVCACILKFEVEYGTN